MITSGKLTGNNTVVIPVNHVGIDALSRELITEDIGDATGQTDLEVSPDGGTTWFTRATVTIGTPLEFKVRSGETFRLNVTSGTSPDINYWVF